MTKPETVQVELKIPASGFPRRMFFNCFFIQKIDGHSLFHFGLVDESSLLRDYYACLVTLSSMAENLPRFGPFLQGLGAPTRTEIVPWVPPASPSFKTDFANMISLANANEGEILFYSFALNPAISISRKLIPGPMQADPVAMLHCDIDTLRLLVVQLYPTSEPK